MLPSANSRRLLALAALSVLALGLALACGDSAVPSPFEQPDAGAAGDGGVDAPGDAAPDVDPTLGGPCLDDSQCDDGVACTVDGCDLELHRCRFVPDHASCADAVFCDGQEVCDQKLGCREGEPVACSDDNTCTIDACVEATQSCVHSPRDSDGDGDPDKNCGGGDCNDANPLVSSLSVEVCANTVDDDCDGDVDESECSTPKHDTCFDPLEIASSGVFSLSLAAAQSDYAVSCVAGGGAWRDVVAAIVVPAGPALDVDVIAETASGSLALAALGQCGAATSELACHLGVASLKSSVVSRLRLRSLPAGAYPLYVLASGASDVTLSVQFLPAEPAPSNETCGTAESLAPGTHAQPVLIGVADDVPSACSSETGELVWKFTLAAPQDVDVYATSLDGWGAPSVSLRSDACSSEADELGCQTVEPGHVFARALPAGTHSVTLAASAPTVVDFVVELSPPTTAPADETCSGPPALLPGQTLPVSLAQHTDDVKLGCVAGAADAAYALDLGQTSDVLLVGRLSNGDTGGVLLAAPPCQQASELLACGKSGLSPVRAAAHGVAAGSLRAIVESLKGNPMELTAFVRPAAPPILVPLSDTCAQAFTIPPGGARLMGNTANASADYDAGCDLGSQAPGGARDQMLRLVLPTKRRVVLDMKGSGYDTLLDVRKGPACPGSELPAACAAGYVADKSFLDLTLEAGEYFVQIDGYAGDKGPWVLDVFLADP